MTLCYSAACKISRLHRPTLTFATCRQLFIACIIVRGFGNVDTVAYKPLLCRNYILFLLCNFSFLFFNYDTGRMLVPPFSVIDALCLLLCGVHGIFAAQFWVAGVLGTPLTPR